ALVASGRHELVAFTTPVPFDVSRPEPAAAPVGAFAAAGALTDRPLASAAPIATDAVRRPSAVEEILADPAIEAGLSSATPGGPPCCAAPFSPSATSCASTPRTSGPRPPTRRT